MTSTEELTRWIETHCPKELSGSTFAYSGGTHQAISDPAFQSWFDACLERGFTVPDWPVEYGGVPRLWRDRFFFVCSFSLCRDFLFGLGLKKYNDLLVTKAQPCFAINVR